jgi:hypothetical protein
MEGSPENQMLQIVFCQEDEKDDGREDKAYTVVEVEYRYMGYHKTFRSKKKCVEYDATRQELRDAYLKIEKMVEEGRPEGEVLRERKAWLEMSCDWNNRWGESYTPEDLRMAIDRNLQEVDAGIWLWWNPFKVQETTPKQLRGVNHFKVEAETSV